MKIRTIITVGALMFAGCAIMSRESGPAYVDEFDLSASSCGFGQKVKKFDHGFYAHAESAIKFNINEKVTAFDAMVELAPEAIALKRCNHRGEVIFKVWADDKIVAKVVVAEKQPARAIHAELKGAKTVILETTSSSSWRDFLSAGGNWKEAHFTCEAGAKIEVDDNNDLYEQLGVLTPAEKPEPQFNGADIWGVRPGHPVIFRIPVSGKRPMKFTANNLPDGVYVNELGVLLGKAPTKKGDYDIEVSACNAYGTATKIIRLAVGDTIALTPPMGWNSWNVWCYRLTAESAKIAADAMVNSGLADYGFAYVNLDDWWQMNNTPTAKCARVSMRQKDLGREDVIGKPRDAQGYINPNRSFPNMKELTSYIHERGLKAGIYSSPGENTCGLCEGSLDHEEQDAESWAKWGFDYVKYDWCSYQKVFRKRTNIKNQWADESIWDKPEIRAEFIRPYAKMNECLKKQNRDILYSYCQYGMGRTERWGRENGANCWRTFGDLKDGWTWMEEAIDSRINGEFWKYCGPGFWPDPDMMIIGQQYSYGYDHPTFLTPNEQYTHVSIWAMLSAPLLTGCDLAKLDEFTLSLLKNHDVIAISQDRKGEVARRIRHTDAESVWLRHLENGDVAVALLNRSPVKRSIGVTLSELGLSDVQCVRDCWRQKDEGKVSGSYYDEVPAHATKLLRFSRVKCSKCD